MGYGLQFSINWYGNPGSPQRFIVMFRAMGSCGLFCMLMVICESEVSRISCVNGLV